MKPLQWQKGLPGGVRALQKRLCSAILVLKKELTPSIAVILQGVLTGLLFFLIINFGCYRPMSFEWELWDIHTCARTCGVDSVLGLAQVGLCAFAPWCVCVDFIPFCPTKNSGIARGLCIIPADRSITRKRSVWLETASVLLRLCFEVDFGC